MIDYEDLRWYTAATESDTDAREAPEIMRAMAEEILVLRDFIKRYREASRGDIGRAHV